MGRIRVGRTRVRPDTPAHVEGIRQGNQEGAYLSQPGHHADGSVDSRRSTGILPGRRDPIHTSMPNLPPG